MPILRQDEIRPSLLPPFRVALEQAHNIITSLSMLAKRDLFSGLPEWVYQTYDSMSEAERQNNNLVMIGLHHAVLPQESWSSFPAFIDYLSRTNPDRLRDNMLNMYDSMQPLEEIAPEDLLHLKEALQSEENYVLYLQQRFEAENVIEEIESRAYHYVIDPPALQKVIVEHLWHMWTHYLKDEWERNRPMLQEVVRAYRQVDFSHMTREEAMKLVTGHEQVPEKWCGCPNPSNRIIFVPHPHTGPYITKAYVEEAGKDTLMVFFGARLPLELTRDAPELSRAEIGIRLGALADDNRLSILRLVAERGELRSGDIMNALNLSQSAASRHLSQLSATGYLVERRCDGAKCYALNPERIQETLKAIASFLLIEERSMI